MAHHFVGVAELADALDLGSSAVRRGGCEFEPRLPLQIYGGLAKW